MSLAWERVVDFARGHDEPRKQPLQFYSSVDNAGEHGK